eukprot:2625523-Ditylum_brightwellii.AAC.1
MEQKELMKEMGFGHKTFIDELMYAHNDKGLGFFYWRIKYCMDLDIRNHKRWTLRAIDYGFIYPLSADAMTVYVDDVHATDMKARRSDGTYIVTLLGTDVA